MNLQPRTGKDLRAGAPNRLLLLLMMLLSAQRERSPKPGVRGAGKTLAG